MHLSDSVLKYDEAQGFVLGTLKLYVWTQISMSLAGGSLGACRFELLLLGELDGVED